MPFTHRGRAKLRGWTTFFVVVIWALIAVAAIIGLLIYQELREVTQPKDDFGFSIFQLGFEHQRLLFSAETESPPAELRLRGDIYLSRVFLVRDTPSLASLRQGELRRDLAKLFQSASVTERLLDGVDSRQGRDALLRQLRGDANSVRDLMLKMALANLDLRRSERASHADYLLLYLGMLEFLLVGLLGVGIFVLLIIRRLRETGRVLAGQFATQNAILHSVGDAMLGVGPGGAVLYSNPQALALLGPFAATGALLFAAPHGENDLLNHIQSLVELSRQPGEDGPWEMRNVIVTDGDRPKYFVLRMFRAVPAIASQPDDASLIISIADVTTTEEAMSRREEYDARLGEVSRLLAYAAISGGIVHEISQPLAAIRNYIYALKISLGLRSGNEEHRAIVEHLGVEIDRAIEVVRNVRRMGPQDPQEAGACDIHEAIAHSVRLVTLGSSPQPSITVDAAPVGTQVNGSLPLVGQVIVNLLQNALSASAAVGRPGAAVTVTTQGGMAAIAVADFGMGVSEDAATSMFKPFSRSARGGMGLGLAICQRIAASLGGSLSWQNRPEAGATFIFTIPLAKEGNAT